MKQKLTTLNLVTTALLCALGVVLNMSLHALCGKTVSSLISAMHLTVLLCGLLCGPWLGLACGVISPLTSFAVSGGAMPPFPQTLVPMLAELALYGLICGALRSAFVTQNRLHHCYHIVTLVIAMIAGRFVSAIVSTAILTANGVPFVVAWWGNFVHKFTATWVGIIIQITAIPTILLTLRRAGVLAKYYDVPAN